MQIIPVLDILNGLVVRGVAGRRDEYAAVESVLCSSAEPIAVACAIRERFGLGTFYVADLDAILNHEPHFDLFRQLVDEGFELLVDAGLRHPSEVDSLLTAGAAQVIVGLETWPLLSSLEMLLQRTGPERLIFSLDLKNGEPLGTFSDLAGSEPMDIAAAVLEAGIRELIVLDLAAVGVGQGTTTASLCGEILDFAPRARLTTGGGVRNADDISSLAANGIAGVLVASALHDGRLTSDDLASFTARD